MPPQVEVGYKPHLTGCPQSLLSSRLTVTAEDGKNREGKTREVNVLRGLPASAPINISMYVRYNSTSQKNSYSCGQTDRQTWQTDKHEVTCFHMENKLCKLCHHFAINMLPQMVMVMQMNLVGYRMSCQQSRQNGKLTQHISVRHSSDISWEHRSHPECSLGECQDQS